MFESTNKLEFEVARSPYEFIGVPHQMFRVGTCEGQFGSTDDSYYIMSVKNSKKGNGHLNDVFEWFENSAKRDGKNLLVVECINKKFYEHLLSKRGFISLDSGNSNCIKIFNKKLYNKLLRDGNALIKKGSLTCI